MEGEQIIQLLFFAGAILYSLYRAVSKKGDDEETRRAPRPVAGMPGRPVENDPFREIFESLADHSVDDEDEEEDEEFEDEPAEEVPVAPAWKSDPHRTVENALTAAEYATKTESKTTLQDIIDTYPPGQLAIILPMVIDRYDDHRNEGF